VAGRRLKERYEANVPLSPADRTRVQKATLEVMERFVRSVVKAQVDVSWLGGVVRHSFFLPPSGRGLKIVLPEAGPATDTEKGRLATTSAKRNQPGENART
jgi:hypothetical protein